MRRGPACAAARARFFPPSRLTPTPLPSSQINPWLKPAGRHGTAHALILTCTTGLTLYLYALIVFLDPGPVPPGYGTGAADGGEAGEGGGLAGTPASAASPPTTLVVEVKRKGGGARVCSKCGGAPKPPRAHHCRTCGRCVARMDHHCRWANNCVGAGTARAFVQLLVWAPLAAGHAAWLVGAHLAHSARAPGAGGGAGAAAGASSPWRGVAAEVLALLAALPIAASLAYLSAWHARLLAAGQTTLEHFEGVTAKVVGGAAKGVAAAAALPGGAPLAHPYDRGPWENAVAVLGPDPLTWLIPPDPRAPGRGAGVAIGGGLAFATAFDGTAASAAFAAGWRGATVAAAHWLGGALGGALAPPPPEAGAPAPPAAAGRAPPPPPTGEAALAAAASAADRTRDD